MPQLDRDGVAIHYDVAGSGPAVLLTHGFSATSHMFKSTVDALSPDHTVITWDIRGHGRSDAPDDPALYTVPLSVGDMEGILDAVGADQVIAGGHSLGGFLSLELRLARPERVAGLLLIDTGPGYRKDEAREGWNRMAERMADRIDEGGVEALRSGGEVDASLHRSAAGVAKAARGILTQQDGRVIDSLPTISVPALVIVGDKDEPYLGGSNYMAEKIPDAELVIIADAGHAPMLDQPEAFVKEVQSFLSRRFS